MKKSELVRKIRKEFPKLKFKKAAHNVEGWDHYVLILDNKYVFRFPRKAEYLRKLKSEPELFEYLKGKINIPIPQYKFMAKDKSFAGYEMLYGTQLTKEVFRKLPKQTKNLVAKQLAGFISVMHRVPVQLAKRFDPDMTNAPKLYHELLVKTRKLLFPKFSLKNQDMVEKYFKELKSCLNFPNRVFIHTDLYAGHILLSTDKKRISGIIDFADRSIDDPAMDFTEFWIYGRKFVETVYQYYRGPKDKDFLYRSQMYYMRVPLWMMIATFKDRKGNFQENYKLFRQIFLDPNTFK